MAHSHCHSHYHHHHYYHGGYDDTSLWFYAVILIDIILIYGAIAVHNDNKCQAAWNNRYHTCGQEYAYHICHECGYIDEIYCESFNFFMEIPDGVELKRR